MVVDFPIARSEIAVTSREPVNIQSPRIAIVVSHPIQHFCPQYASFAKMENAKVKVFFGSCMGRDSYVDKNFGTTVSWGRLYLDEFDHCFLNGDQALPADAQLDAASLDSALNEFAPDVVIVYGHFQKLSRRAVRWARHAGCKLAYIADSEPRQHQSWKRRLLRSWRARYFHPFDFFLTVGDANEEFYIQHGVPSHRFVRMHFSIDKRLYDAAFTNRQQLSSELRAKLAIPADALVVSVVGKLVSWKSQDHLIDLAIQMRAHHANMRYLVIGSGPDEVAWKKRAQAQGADEVVWAGFVSPADLPAYYAATDIYLHPARIEPHSLAISEAIYMGRPVICSDTCGSYGDGDDVQVGLNGFVYSYGNMLELTGQVAKLAHQPGLRQRMGAHSEKISRGFQALSHGGSLQRLVARLTSGV